MRVYLLYSVWPSGSGSLLMTLLSVAMLPFSFLFFPLLPTFAFYFENMLYLCEGLKSVFQVDEKLTELGCAVV